MKNRSAYFVIAFLLIFIFFSYACNQTIPGTVDKAINVSVETGTGTGSPSGTDDTQTQIVLTPDSGPAATQANAQTNSADPKNIQIVLDDSNKGAAPAAISSTKGDAAAQSVSADVRETDSPNPVLAFFSTLATKIQSNFTGGGADQVSIEVGNENEGTDKDVTNEVKIDVENHPITNLKNAAVLIYHTHTREAYTPEYPGQYVPAGSFRTNDPQYSVCAVGQKLADLLSGTYGFSVIHDTAINEATPFTASYDKSLVTMKNDVAKNPNLGVFIDVHRDSISDTAYAQKDIVSSGGKQYARVMFVVGRGDGYTGAEAPEWQDNYALAKAVSDQINQLMPGLSRGIMVKERRYNQQLSDKSMLIEVGYDANTITQAENSVDIVAQAMAAVLSK